MGLFYLECADLMLKRMRGNPSSIRWYGMFSEFIVHLFLIGCIAPPRHPIVVLSISHWTLMWRVGVHIWLGCNEWMLIKEVRVSLRINAYIGWWELTLYNNLNLYFIIIPLSSYHPWRHLYSFFDSLVTKILRNHIRVRWDHQGQSKVQ